MYGNYKRSQASMGGAVRGWKFFLAILLCTLVPSGLVHADDCLVLTSGATNPATLRAEPSASSLKRGTLAQGQSMPLVALVPGWYETRLSDGQMAFVAKRSAEIAPCPAAPGGATPHGIADTRYEIHAIDVGTGLAVLVRGPDFTLLYDAGSNDDLALGDNNRTLAYLKTLRPRLQKIDHVVLSHPHRDHVELLPDVVTRFKPTSVWNSGAYNDICGYRNFLFAIAADPAVQYHTAHHDIGDEAVELGDKTCYGTLQPEQTLTLKHAKRISNEPIPLGRGASMTFLFADGSKRASFNDNSLVVRLDLGSRRILLMGDAEAGGRKLPTVAPTPSSIEGKLLTCCTPDLKADVLVVAHHGSKSSSRTKFLNAVGATTYIVSAGPTKYQTVVLPDAEIIAELERRGRVIRTDFEDDECATSPDKIGPDADGKAGGCNNILITISSSGQVTTEYRRVSD